MMTQNRGFLIFGLIYLGGAAIHLSFAISNAPIYVGLGETSLILPYQWFFSEVVAMNPVGFALLAATVEAMIGAVIISSNHKIALLGMLAGIALQTLLVPLGWWGFLNVALAAAQGYILASAIQQPTLQPA